MAEHDTRPERSTFVPVTIGAVDTSLDADEAGRVLRRAHDLAAAQGIVDDTEAEVSHVGVSGAALVEAAAEVGIDPASVRDALALERFDADLPERGRFDRLAGPSEVTVEHVVRRDPEGAVADAEAWLAVTYRMRCIRTADGELECRPRAGLTAVAGRSMAGATGEANIKAVERLIVSVQPLELGASDKAPRTLVRVIAVRHGTRRRRLGAGSMAGVAGVGVGVAGATAGAVVAGPLLAVPFLVGGFSVARSGSRHADKVELELVRVLSAVDRGERPVGLVGRAARRARRAVADVRDGTD
jgi:hypothetical protein